MSTQALQNSIAAHTISFSFPSTLPHILNDTTKAINSLPRITTQTK